MKPFDPWSMTAMWVDTPLSNPSTKSSCHAAWNGDCAVIEVKKMNDEDRISGLRTLSKKAFW